MYSISLHVVYVCIIVVSNTSANILPSAQNDTFLQKCLSEVEQTYFKSSDIIIYLNLNSKLEVLKLAHPTIIQTNLAEDLILFQLVRANVYLITIAPGAFSVAFQILVESSEWNPKAKFVFILDELEEGMFWLLRTYYVFNVIFLIENETGVEVFTYFPYDYNESQVNQTEAVLLDIFQEAGFKSNLNLFPLKLPSTWENQTVRVALIPYSPYVLRRNCSCVELCGVEPDILALVASMLKFKIEYIEVSYTDWGHKDEYGKYRNGSSGLKNNEFDLGVGVYFPNSSESWDFDLTYPYLEDTQNWVVPIAKLKPPGNTLSLVYKPYAWLLILTAFVATSLSFYFIGTHLDEYAAYGNFSKSFLLTYQCFFGQSVHRQPKSCAIKIVFISWVIICYILTTYLQTKAIVNFNFEHYEKQIKTIQEVISNKLNIGFYADSAFQFWHSDNEIDKYVYTNFIPCPRDGSCSSRVAFKQDFATIKLKRNLEFLASTVYKDSHGQPLIYILNDPTRLILISMAFVRGFPLYEDVNKLIFGLKSSGIIASFYIQMDAARDNHANRNRVLRRSENLGIESFVAYFYILFVGWFLGFVVFLLENLGRLRNFVSHL